MNKFNHFHAVSDIHRPELLVPSDMKTFQIGMCQFNGYYVILVN
jgi:hypothetical protein